MTAECLYRYFCDKADDGELASLAEAFAADDHSLWYLPPSENPFVRPSSGSGENEEDDRDNSESGDGEDDHDGSDGGNGDGTEADEDAQAENEKNSGIGQRNFEEWKAISERVKEDLSTFSKKRGDAAGAMMQNLTELHRERYDYTEFLRKFAVLGEAMKINDDEFDQIFYTYGMQLYGKMPLIEPLEYKEVKRIKEFVIAIDTSGSVSGEIVQRFLQKTYNILMQEESFFAKIELHIIQCDAEVQEDARITCREDFENYLKRMRIHGLGGTDFRPVFEHVGKLQAQHELKHLKGLIYFTDGYGVYPEHQPSYKTAFVFVDDGMNNIHVPVWAIKLIVPIEDI